MSESGKTAAQRDGGPHSPHRVRKSSEDQSGASTAEECPGRTPRSASCQDAREVWSVPQLGMPARI